MRPTTRPVYVFRVDAGVFETDVPGHLLEVAAHPLWLDSLAPTEWVADRPLVHARATRPHSGLHGPEHHDERLCRFTLPAVWAAPSTRSG